MPTPMPIIDTRIGVIVLMSVSPARMKSRMNAVPTATIASAIGIAVATKRAEDDQQHDERRDEAEQLLVPCWIGGGSASPLNSALMPAGATASRTAFSTATTWSRSAVSIVCR